MIESYFAQADRYSAPPLTWIDVARRLAMLEPADPDWRHRPPGLRYAQVDWNAAVFSVDDADSDSRAVLDWLSRIFPQRIREDVVPRLILDGPSPSSSLTIEFEIADSESSHRGSLGSIEGYVDFRTAPSTTVRVRPTPVIACHSVKGGTGRTTTAIAMATTWAEMAGMPILLVDADLEAPGLSYLYRATKPEIDVALEDVIGLAHAASQEEQHNIIRWVSRRLSSQRMGDLVILPLRRSLDELTSSAIRAEHLASADRPYAFADLLAEIAHACGCAGVVVDVRAGLVPLAAQLILDPQVGRVVVSSLAGQSLDATVALMSFVARELRKQDANTQQPLLVINRIPSILSELGGDDTLIAPVVARIESALLTERDEDYAADEVFISREGGDSILSVVKLTEITDLQVPSRRWEGFGEQIRNSGFIRRLNVALVPWLNNTLPSLDTKDPAPTVAASVGEQASPAQRRRMLADFTGRFVAAETADEPVEAPLFTGPMRALALESSLPPIVVCEGAKGTGKTLTARFLLSKKTWRTAVRKITGSEPSFDAQLLPVFGSIQTSEKFLAEIDNAREEVAKSLDLEPPQLVSATRQFLREKIAEGLSEKQWIEIWLDVIAWSAGVLVGEMGAGLELLDYLWRSERKLIAIIEGIEELYETSTDPALHSVLSALLIGLPIRLRSAPGRPLGLIVFARRDTVDAGVSQNRSQFRQQYKNYSLSWTEDDVLELAAWLSTSSGALNIWVSDFRQKPKSEKERLLYQLWGRKLGPDDQPGRARVQEAYTAGWVIAALSDLQERLVARDLVRFLHNAAGNTNQAESRENYGNRLLFPKAIREAIGPTSRSKIAETEEEISELKDTFDKFKENSNQIKAPIDQASVELLKLTSDELEKLKTHGIILGESPPYEVPELYRMGLGLKHAGARYSVIGTRQRARQRLARGL